MGKNELTKFVSPDFLADIKQIVEESRSRVYSAINTAMVDTYWLLGKRIAEEELKGKDRADYGTYLIKELSTILTKEVGKGFSTNSLYYYKKFYTTFPEKLPTLWGKLTWSHYKRLLSCLLYTSPSPRD